MPVNTRSVAPPIGEPAAYRYFSKVGFKSSGNTAVFNRRMDRMKEEKPKSPPPPPVKIEMPKVVQCFPQVFISSLKCVKKLCQNLGTRFRNKEVGTQRNVSVEYFKISYILCT